MKIGIDISQIVYEGTGVATYTSNLVKNLLKVGKNDQFILFGSSLRKRKKLKDFIEELQVKNVKTKFSFLPPMFLEFLWNGIHVFPVENFTGEIDVFHSSDWLEPPTKKAKKVTTIHDFAVYKYPETFSARGGHNIVANQKRRMHFVKNYCDKIICVSETTKKDAGKILHIPEKKMEVIYEAPDEFFSQRGKLEIDRVREKFAIEGDYLLCVGTREPRKNLDRVIMAFAQITEEFPGLSLVIAGKYGWGDNEMSNVKCLPVGKAGQMSNVKLLGFVEREDLARLYSGARAFVYPSLYEGFGLPILEAMSCGCPVITSNVGAMAEIAGLTASLVNPVSVEEITIALSRILRSPIVAEKLIAGGLQRARDFSWEKTALQTLTVYHSLLE